MSKLIFNPLSGNFDTVNDQASEINYDNSTSGLTATQVQDAIDEVQSNIDNLPNPITYKGTWDASTNTPTLANTDTGKTGYLYQVAVGGTVNFGAGPISFDMGDKVVNDGTAWQKWDMTDAVTSVNSQTGAVVLTTDNISEGTTNLYFTTERAQDATGAMATNSSKVSLTYNDPANTLTADIISGSLVNADISATAGIDATKLGTGVVDNTELSYLDGVTSSIQTQLNGKQATGNYVTSLTGDVTGSGPGATATTIANGAVTNVKVSSGIDAVKIGAGSVDNTEFSYLDGVTSSIQTQLNGKQATGNYITALTGDITASGPGSAAATLATVNSNVGTFGSASNVAQVTLDGKGRATAASNVAIQIAESQVTNLVSDLAGKEPTITVLPISKGGTNSGTALIGNKAVITNGTQIVESATTSTEISYLSGARSSVQNQIDQQATNYILKNNFEDGTTTGWSLGIVGTLTNGIPTGTPTFGSGASGNLSISASTSNPISGTRSLAYASSSATTQGNMLATDSLAIDPADQAKVLTGKFYYSIPTNPTNGNFSGTSANSFGIACWDVTNSSWIPVVGNFAMTQNSGVGIATVTMQTNVTTANIRFVIYNVNATAGAITVNFDRFYLGPQTAPIGPVMTDWMAYTPTVVGFGSATAISAYSRRVGDELEVQGVFTTGTPSAVVASVSLGFNGINGGVAVNTSKISGGTVGVGALGAASTTLFSLVVTYGSTTTVNFGLQSSTTVAASNAALGTQIASGSGQVINFKFSVPIQGWSSNVQMSNDTDTRVIALFARSTATTSISPSIETQLTYSNIVTDTAGAFNGTTYTAPVSGIYRATASTAYNGTTNTGDFRIFIRKNNTTFIYSLFNKSGSGNFVSQLATTGDIPLSAGDTLTFYTYNNTAASVSLQGDNNLQTLSIDRISGPAVIAATESVNGSYTDTSGFSITSTPTAISFNTKIRDSHNALSGSTLTIPVSGEYRFSATGTTNSVTNSTSQVFNLSIFRNGTMIVQDFRFGNGASVNYSATPSVSYPCLAGDTIQVKVSNSNTIAAGSGAGNWTFCWERVGN